MVKPEYVTEGIIMFAEAELLPALEGWRLWVGAAAMALVRQRAGEILAKIAGNKIVSGLGLVDKDGMIDIDAAAAALKQAARKYGKLSLDIPTLDIAYNFTEHDVDTLCGYIEKAAGV